MAMVLTASSNSLNEGEVWPLTALEAGLLHCQVAVHRQVAVHCQVAVHRQHMLQWGGDVDGLGMSTRSTCSPFGALLCASLF